MIERVAAWGQRLVVFAGSWGNVARRSIVSGFTLRLVVEDIWI